MERLLAELHQSEGARLHEHSAGPSVAAVTEESASASVDTAAPSMEQWHPEVMGHMVNAHNELNVRRRPTHSPIQQGLDVEGSLLATPPRHGRLERHDALCRIVAHLSDATRMLPAHVEQQSSNSVLSVPPLQSLCVRCARRYMAEDGTPVWRATEAIRVPGRLAGASEAGDVGGDAVAGGVGQRGARHTRGAQPHRRPRDARGLQVQGAAGASPPPTPSRLGFGKPPPPEGSSKIGY